MSRCRTTAWPASISNQVFYIHNDPAEPEVGAGGPNSVPLMHKSPPAPSAVGAVTLLQQLESNREAPAEAVSAAREAVRHEYGAGNLVEIDLEAHPNYFCRQENWYLLYTPSFQQLGDPVIKLIYPFGGRME